MYKCSKTIRIPHQRRLAYHAHLVAPTERFPGEYALSASESSLQNTQHDLDERDGLGEAGLEPADRFVDLVAILRATLGDASTQLAERQRKGATLAARMARSFFLRSRLRASRK